MKRLLSLMRAGMATGDAAAMALCLLLLAMLAVL
jgi:hypothetical protein